MKEAESLKYNISDKIKGFFQGDKKIKFIVIAGFLGILFIFLSTGKPDSADKNLQKSVLPSTFMQELTTQMENKLQAVIGNIQGVGNCQVMVTFENGIEYVYANESKATSDVLDEGESGKKQEKISSENNLVIIEQGNGKEALKVKEIQPKVRGVVVVCDGAQDVAVRQQIIDAVTTSMDISSAKVYVAKAAAKY